MSISTYSVVVHPSGPLGGQIVAPPSKNYSTRLILGASLADGVSVIRRPAANDDARALVACCRALGARIEEEGGDLRITGFGARPKDPGRLNPGNAGAVLRLLLGTACLVGGDIEFVTDYAESLGKRPNEDLLKALRQLGAKAEGTGPDGRLPIRIDGSHVHGGRVRVSGRKSSQFLSSLLYLCPFLEGDSWVEVGDDEDQGKPVLVSRPLIDQTLDALAKSGVTMDREPNGLVFYVKGNQTAQPIDTVVNGDWPSAAALMAAVAVAGGMVTIHGLSDDAQGERRAADYLESMGCVFMNPRPGELIVHGNTRLNAAVFNGDLATDAVLALVAAACFAEGTSRFENIGNLRIKESDRIREPLEELAKIGVSSRSGADWIEIDGGPEGYEGGVECDSRGDHRVAQMLAIVGSRCRRGLTIRRAEHVSKSYPEFFEDLARLGVKLDILTP